MDSRPRKISESRYAGLYFDLFGARISRFLLPTSHALEARRATIYTRLSGWANKVPYIGYDGGRCREHNGSRSPPPPLVGFLRKLTILFRERRLYEKRSSPLDISIGSEREREIPAKSRDYIYRELNLYLSDNNTGMNLLACQRGYLRGIFEWKYGGGCWRRQMKGRYGMETEWRLRGGMPPPPGARV